MPEAYNYAFAVTMSGREDLPRDVVRAAISWFAKAKYHAVCLEESETGRLHLHAGVIFENAKKACNVKACLMYPKCIRDWFAENNAKHCIQVKKMSSEYWLATYMQKDGPLEVCTFPDDLAYVAYAFASEKEQKKAMNPEFAKWARMYFDQERPIPATENTTYDFFHYNMYVADTLKILPDQKRLKDRCLCLREYLNKNDMDYTPYHGVQRTEAEKIATQGLNAEEKLHKIQDRYLQQSLGDYLCKDSA